MAHRLILDGQLHLYGPVGFLDWNDQGFTELDVAAALAEMTGDITVRLNSGGGYALSGIAIRAKLADYARGAVTVVIDGVAASAASVIAMAGQRVHMALGALMMIHNPAVLTAGDATELRKTADDLDTLAAEVVKIYAARSGLPADEVRRMMDDETWLGAEAAAKLGFADIVDVPDDDTPPSMAAWDYTLYQRPPASVMAASRKLEAVTFRRASSAVRPAAPQGVIHMADNPLSPAPTAPVVSTPPAVTAVTPPVGPAPSSPQSASLQADIFARCQAAHLTMDEAASVMASPTLAAAQDAIIAQLAARQPAAPRVTASVTADGYDRARTGIAKAITLRAGYDGGENNEFRGLTLMELGRHLMSIGGATMIGRDRMSQAAVILGMRGAPMMSGGMHSTSDFANILADVANKGVLKGFQDAVETFDRWTAKGNLPDFKPMTRVDLGLADTLSEVPEGAEYTYGTVSDRKETIQLATYGKKFALTRQAIINDDLSMLTRIPTRMGTAAKRTIGNLVWAVLTANGLLSDGVALFAAGHSNLATGAGSVLSVASLSVARTAMRLQKDPDSKTQALNIAPKYLLVPAALESSAKQLISSVTQVGQDNPNVSNPVSGMAEVLSEARLDAASSTAWYLAADPNLVDTVEVAYLDGIETPYMEQVDDQDVDGVTYKVRIDAGVKALGFRGLYKAAGA